MTDHILQTNLIHALIQAIESQSKYEKEVLHFSMDSGMVAGWKENLKSLEEGKLWIKYE